MGRGQHGGFASGGAFSSQAAKSALSGVVRSHDASGSTILPIEGEVGTEVRGGGGMTISEDRIRVARFDSPRAAAEYATRTLDRLARVSMETVEGRAGTEGGARRQPTERARVVSEALRPMMRGLGGAGRLSVVVRDDKAFSALSVPVRAGTTAVQQTASIRGGLSILGIGSQVVTSGARHFVLLGRPSVGRMGTTRGTYARTGATAAPTGLTPEQAYLQGMANRMLGGKG